jgi:hypothetical protein
MRKPIIAAIAGLSVCAFTVPVFANSGHIIQVHHGADCVEFVLLEDAPPACVPSPGVVDDVCLAIANVPWYGVATGPQLTVGQIPFFTAATSAIDTAYRAYVNELQIVIVQNALGAVFGGSVSPAEKAALDKTSLVGFTPNGGTFACRNLGLPAGNTHPVASVGNINIPAVPNQ